MYQSYNRSDNLRRDPSRCTKATISRNNNPRRDSHEEKNGKWKELPFLDESTGVQEYAQVDKQMRLNDEC